MENSLLALVINCGSSSLKFAVMGEQADSVMVEGVADKLGSNESTITFKVNGQKTTEALSSGTHAEAVNAIRSWLDKNPHIGERLVGIGHRIVHGGEAFTQSTVIDDTVLKGIEDCSRFAPLHNPANITGIEEGKRLFEGLDHVAVFDTAFHQSLTKEAYLYPIPMRYYRDHNLRKFGFHGTSYRFVSEHYTRNVGKQEHGIVVAHLGNGASVCAIQDGEARDTSMGITPLEGLMMGTRSGSIDPSLITFIENLDNVSTQEALDVLNKKSGLLGVSELSNDCRTLEEAAESGHEQAILALDMFASRTAKQIASLATTLDRLDAVVFTGGIGENSSYLREKIAQRLGLLGISIDAKANNTAPRGEQSKISTGDCPDVWIIPTNEELMIARDTLKLIMPAQ